MKRLFKFATLLGCLTSTLALAVPPFPTASALSGIKESTPFVKDDAYKIFAFFKFNCPICRNYHVPLEYWGKSLPKPFTFQFYPAIEGDNSHPISNDSALSSMMFWVVENSGNRNQRANFAEGAYVLTQDLRMQSNSEEWMRTVKESEIRPSKFSATWIAEQNIWPTRIHRQIHYHPTATPTLVICGKWSITPDSTNGDQELFFQLASALVSKCMIEHGVAPK